MVEIFRTEIFRAEIFRTEGEQRRQRRRQQRRQRRRPQRRQQRRAASGARPRVGGGAAPRALPQLLTAPPRPQPEAAERPGASAASKLPPRLGSLLGPDSCRMDGSRGGIHALCGREALPGRVCPPPPLPLGSGQDQRPSPLLDGGALLRPESLFAESARLHCSSSRLSRACRYGRRQQRRQP